MAYKPIRMDIINNIKQLKSQGKGIKAIAKQLHISKNTVKKYLAKLDTLNLDTDQPLGDDDLQRVYSDYYQRANSKKEKLLELLPSFIEKLKLTGMTRELIWKDYIQQYPQGYSYGEFCRQIKKFKKINQAVLMLNHKPGHVMQVDFAGKKLKYYDSDTSTWIYVPVLICTLPFSGRVFAVALSSQGIENFVHGMSAAISYFGGVPQMILSDNLKSYVKKTDRYCPSFTQLATQMSQHYNLELDAARVAQPRDKGHVERHVTIVYQNIYSKLHDEKPKSLDELNQLISFHLEKLNDKQRQQTNMSRNEYFEAYEKTYLADLPATEFCLTKSTRATVQQNYHVLLGEDTHYYSVPYKYIGQKVDIVYTRTDVEIFIGVRRIAFHKRDTKKRAFTTIDSHRSKNHLVYLANINLSPKDFIDKAALIGPNATWAMEHIINSNAQHTKTHKLAMGFLSLARHYSDQRIEQICTYIKPCGTITLNMIKNVLSSNIDKLDNHQNTEFTAPDHDNIRGASNYK